jgi:DNA-binding MarR family transcriptional regulator
MSGQTLDRDVEELAGIAVSLLSFKGRLKLSAPEEAAGPRPAPGASCHPGGGALPADCGLFLRVASLLSGHPRAITMGELSRALEVPLSTATRVVDWQVEHGYMERLPDPNDRRLVRVALSDDGRELFVQVSALLRERIRRVAVAFAPAERELLITLLRKLVAVLSDLDPARAEGEVPS